MSLSQRRQADHTTAPPELGAAAGHCWAITLVTDSCCDKPCCVPGSAEDDPLPYCTSKSARTVLPSRSGFTQEELSLATMCGPRPLGF